MKKLLILTIAIMCLTFIGAYSVLGVGDSVFMEYYKEQPLDGRFYAYIYHGESVYGVFTGGECYNRAVVHDGQLVYVRKEPNDMVGGTFGTITTVQLLHQRPDTIGFIYDNSLTRNSKSAELEDGLYPLWDYNSRVYDMDHQAGSKYTVRGNLLLYNANQCYVGTIEGDDLQVAIDEWQGYTAEYDGYYAGSNLLKIAGWYEDGEYHEAECYAELQSAANPSKYRINTY